MDGRGTMRPTYLFVALIACALLKFYGFGALERPATTNTPAQTAADKSVIVGVSREPAYTVTEKDLTNRETVKRIESRLVLNMKTQTDAEYTARTGKTAPNMPLNSESWSITSNGHHFAIIRTSITNMLQSTIIIGIDKGNFVKITCMRDGSELVPYSDGPCADKLKEVFGFSIPESARHTVSR